MPKSLAFGTPNAAAFSWGSHDLVFLIAEPPDPNYITPPEGMFTFEFPRHPQNQPPENMKKSLRPLLVASAAFIAPQMASAAVVVGYSAFPTSPNYAPTVIADGFTSTLTVYNDPTQGFPVGGNNTTWGDSGIEIPDPQTNNGFIGLNAAMPDGDPTRVAGYFELTLTSTGGSTPLSALLFDYATTSETDFEISFNNVTVPFHVAASTSDITNPVVVDSSLDLTPYNLFLLDGDSITFTFRNLNSGFFGPIAFDNIALIPEPGSLLALGALMGGGVFFRSRRRRA